MPLHIQTPLFESRAISIAAGRSIWLKMEAMQPPGSYNIRGEGFACEQHAKRGASQFISSSGGNAGIAVAYAGRHLSIPVTVVVPATTTERAKELIRQERADVIVHGATWQEANAFAQSLLNESTAFIHPFDDPLLWQGHATMIDEVAQSTFKPDAVMLSVGGGGLLSGVVEGLRRNGWSAVPVVAVETEGAASLNAAIQEKQLVELEKISSIATSLGAKRVCEQAWRVLNEHSIHSLIVTDKAAVNACNQFFKDQRVLIEPACGAALAPAYSRSIMLEKYENVLVIICGGVTASFEQMQQWTHSLK